ncbi:hypothetical protein [Caballeronia sordidicola]|uniref:hypothetical protein n=1 Tax=Caballeronia sordidicola TaxID=196367 RepID=UPI00094CFFA9|nr:hypothetical protein [Caballeronia sordidicola]
MANTQKLAPFYSLHYASERLTNKSGEVVSPQDLLFLMARREISMYVEIIKQPVRRKVASRKTKQTPWASLSSTVQPGSGIFQVDLTPFSSYAWVMELAVGPTETGDVPQAGDEHAGPVLLHTDGSAWELLFLYSSPEGPATYRQDYGQIDIEDILLSRQDLERLELQTVGFPAPPTSLSPDTPRKRHSADESHLKIIAALALLLSKTNPRYLVNGTTNESQIAAKVQEILDAFPNGALRRGVGTSSIRTAISEGEKLLRA